MDSSLISATAALIGASIGGLTSVLASWVLHQRQVRVQWVAQEVDRRRDLYKEFIEDASKCYVDALQHDTGDIPGLVALHATISECAFFRRRLSWQALRKYEEKFSILMLNPTRVCPSSASLSEPTEIRSIFSASLAGLAARNSTLCARLCDRGRRWTSHDLDGKNRNLLGAASRSKSAVGAGSTMDEVGRL